VLLEALPKEWSGRLMGQMIELDEAIDAAGYLRLSTTARYTRHIGNMISPELWEEARSLHLNTGEGRFRVVSRRRRWLMRLPGRAAGAAAPYTTHVQVAQ
jgi:hypothetical protein